MSEPIRAPTPEGVRLTRDEHGVPHVEAEDLLGAHWGLGYCHALDRGLQMNLMRLLGQGRATECLRDSDELLEVDRFFRRMNWKGNMRPTRDPLDEECRGLAEAYCGGINARFREARPWELRLVGYEPEPWRVEDTLLIARMTGYVTLAQSQAEIERLLVELVQAGVPDDALEALFPGNLGGLDRGLLERVTLGERVVPEALRWLSPAPRMMASNSWVVSGARTASGRPLMANDPHLEINRLPNIWVEQVVELPDGWWLGASMPGLPAMLVGRSAHLAWGATYSFADAVDSWVEHCRDGRYRREEDEWAPFRVRTEVIRRKKSPDVTVTYYENDHGVLDGDPTVEGYYLATRWASSESGAASLAAIRDLWSARTVEEGQACLGRIESSFSWVLADDEGHIGFQMSGTIPVRHPEANGFLPRPGWRPELDWQGFVDPADLPRSIDPEKGYVVTANQDLNALGRSGPINLAMGDHRARRIAERLEAVEKVDTETCAGIQMDDHSLQAAEFLEVLRPLLPETEAGRVLSEWDCRYDPGSRGAVAFETFYDGLIVELFAPVVGEEVLRFLTSGAGLFIAFYQNVDRVLLAESSPWHAGRTRNEAFRAALARLPERIDETWGERNPITLTNIFFAGRMPRLLGFDRGPVPLRGGRATPHQGQVFESAGRTTSFGPSLRLIADLGEKTLLTAMPGGPSDRRFSRWYDSGTADWLAGRHKTLRPSSSGEGG
jgi:penicillin amidase